MMHSINLAHRFAKHNEDSKVSHTNPLLITIQVDKHNKRIPLVSIIRDV